MTAYIGEKEADLYLRIESCAGHLYTLGSAVTEMRKQLSKLEEEIAAIRAEHRRRADGGQVLPGKKE